MAVFSAMQMKRSIQLFELLKIVSMNVWTFVVSLIGFNNRSFKIVRVLISFCVFICKVAYLSFWFLSCSFKFSTSSSRSKMRRYLSFPFIPSFFHSFFVALFWNTTCSENVSSCVKTRLFIGFRTSLKDVYQTSALVWASRTKVALITNGVLISSD